MPLLKKIDSVPYIPICLKEDKSFFEQKFIQKQPFQWIALHKGGCSENFLLKTPKQTLFIKKPHFQPKQTLQNITYSLILVGKAHIKAPQVLAQSPHHTLVLEFIQGHSIPSPQLREKHLIQLWQEYQKLKKIPVQQITKRPFVSLTEMYDSCQKRLNHLSQKSFIRTFLFKIIRQTFNSFTKSEIIHHPQKVQAIHGDFHNNNVLFQQNQLSGIIDWEELTIGYASEDWLRYTFCLIERLGNYYQRRQQTTRVLTFLLSKNTFSKSEWALGFDSVLIQKIYKILNDKKLSLFRLLKATLFSLFWKSEKEWVMNQLEK